jgi:hypothetical protein
MHCGISTATTFMRCTTRSRYTYENNACLSFARARAPSEILAWERQIRLFMQFCEESIFFFFPFCSCSSVRLLQFAFTWKSSLLSVPFTLGVNGNSSSYTRLLVYSRYNSTFANTGANVLLAIPLTLALLCLLPCSEISENESYEIG